MSRVVVLSFLFLAYLSASPSGAAQVEVLNPDYRWDEIDFRIADTINKRGYQYFHFDEEDYVWAAYPNSLVRFDGLKFRAVKRPPWRQHPHNTIQLHRGPGNTISLLTHYAPPRQLFPTAGQTLSHWLIDRSTLRRRSIQEYFADNPPPAPYDRIGSCYCTDAGKRCVFGLIGGGHLLFREGNWTQLESFTPGAPEPVQHVSFADGGDAWVIYPQGHLVYSEAGELRFRGQHRRSLHNTRRANAGDVPLFGTEMDASFDAQRLPDHPGNVDPDQLPPYGTAFNTYTMDDGLSLHMAISGSSPTITKQGDTIARLPPFQYTDLRGVSPQGRLWFSTYEGFTVGQLRQRSIRSLLTGGEQRISVRGIQSATDGTLWANTYSGVFSMPGPTTAGVTSTPVAHPECRAYGMAMSLTTAGHILSGLHADSFRIIDPTLGTTELKSVATITPGYGVNQVFQDGDDLYALAGDGIHRRRGHQGWQALFLPDTSSFIFSYGGRIGERILLASDQGLWELGPDQDTPTRVSAIGSLAVYHFDVAEDTIYLATAKGLGIWRPAADTFQLIPAHDPAQPAALHGVYAYAGRYVFASSDDGILRYDLPTGEIKKFTTVEGLPHNECNRMAHHRGDDGTLYFGTISGIAYFHPDDLLPTGTLPLRQQSLGIDYIDLRQPDERTVTLPPPAGGAPLDLPVAYTAVEVGLNFPGSWSADLAGIRYRLRGVSEAWRTVNDGIVYFSKPAPGDYTLEMIGIQANGEAIGAPVRLHLDVRAPWYRRPWFYGGVTLLAYSLGLLWIQRYRRRVIARERELKRRIAAATAAINKDRALMSEQNVRLHRLNTEKARFMSIIGHDLKGSFVSLMGINGNIQYLLERGQHQRLRDFSNNVELVVIKCYDTLSNLLISGQEETMQRRHLPVDLAVECGKQLELLRAAACLQSVHIDYRSGGTRLPILGSPYLFNSLFRNLVSNAVAHSPREGAVIVALQPLADGSVRLSVEDSGPGMSAEKLRELRQLSSMDGWEASGSTSGLGWYVIRIAIAYHHARCELSNRAEGGFSVTVTFPGLHSSQINTHSSPKTQEFP